MNKFCYGARNVTTLPKDPWVPYYSWLVLNWRPWAHHSNLTKIMLKMFRLMLQTKARKTKNENPPKLTGPSFLANKKKI